MDFSFVRELENEINMVEEPVAPKDEVKENEPVLGVLPVFLQKAFTLLARLARTAGPIQMKSAILGPKAVTNEEFITVQRRAVLEDLFWAEVGRVFGTDREAIGIRTGFQVVDASEKYTTPEATPSPAPAYVN